VHQPFSGDFYSDKIIQPFLKFPDIKSKKLTRKQHQLAIIQRFRQLFNPTVSIWSQPLVWVFSIVAHRYEK